MNKTYKSQLQEYCQHNGYEFPKYITERSGGLDHKPQFITNITVTTKEGEITETSNSKRSKKESQQLAAQQLLQRLNQSTSPHNVDWFFDTPNTGTSYSDFDKIVPVRDWGVWSSNESSEKSQKLDLFQEMCRENDKGFVTVFIDLENLNQLKEYTRLIEKTSFNHRIVILGFISEFHHLARKNFPFKVLKVKSNRQNVCDVALSMYTSVYLKENNHITHAIIASRDNFAGAVVDTINTNFIGLSSRIEAANAYDVTNILQILKEWTFIYDV